jgi:hypothetical protein
MAKGSEGVRRFQAFGRRNPQEEQGMGTKMK